MRKRNSRAAVAMIALAATTLAACSSGGGGTSGGGGNQGATGGTLKIGLIADLTGPYSSAFTTSEKGLEAYVQHVNSTGGINGDKLSYVVVDTTSTVTGALTAAQKLVQSDHVFATVADSAVFSGAEPYLLQQGVPVFGGGFDGPEWAVSSNTNLFDSAGVTDYSTVSTATGQYMKAHGVTSCGAVGYANATAGPSAVGVVKSCVAAGLKNGYLNTQVPPGTTDVGPIALAIKKAGVDGIELPVVVSTAFAILGALKQLGVKLKVALISTGYGGDLLASSAAVQAAQGYTFQSWGQPIETGSAATKAMAANLAKVGVTGTPTFAEQVSYIAAAALAAGLKAAGKSPSQKSLAAATRKITDFDGDGLLSPGKVDFSNPHQVGTASGPGGCIFPATLSGKKFVSGKPFCGTVIKGLSTS